MAAWREFTQLQPRTDRGDRGQTGDSLTAVTIGVAFSSGPKDPSASLSFTSDIVQEKDPIWVARATHAPDVRILLPRLHTSCSPLP